jgi:UTP--glucose-1-phosphate uridylyltransferase
VLHQVPDEIPFVDLGGAYKLVDDFDARFPAGVPSLRAATALRVEGDWTFGAEVTCVGDVAVGAAGSPGQIADGTRLSG